MTLMQKIKTMSLPSRLFGLFAFLIMLTGCQRLNSVEKPKNLIPDEQMVEILIDLAKIDAARNVNVEEFEREGGDRAKQLLFQKYGIDSVQLVQSTAYYAEKLKMNDSIYSRVKTRLKIENDSLLKEKNGEQDSE